MIYTNQEMIFFNSLLDGNEIFGLKIDFPFIADTKYIEGTISSLQKKGLIDSSKKLIKTKENPTPLLEFYKKSEKHILLNNMRIALCGNEYAILISRVNDGFKIISLSKKHLFVYLVSQISLLNKQIKLWEDGDKERFSVNEIKEMIYSFDLADIFFIQKYIGQTLTEDYTLTIKSDTALLFNGKRKDKQVVNGQFIRLLLLDIFEIDLEEN